MKFGEEPAPTLAPSEQPKSPNFRINEIMRGEVSVDGEKSKEGGWFEKTKDFLSNPKIQKQIGKTMLGSLASIAGVKSFYDVPEYFRERWQVRGMFGKGKGLSGSVEELLESSWDNSKRVASGGEKSTNVRDSIKDLNKRLDLTKEGGQKNSEQRKMIAQLLWENRKIKVESGQAESGSKNEESIAEEQIDEDLEGGVYKKSDIVADHESFSETDKQKAEVNEKINWAKESGDSTALKIVGEYEQKREMNLENARGKMTEILDNYTTTKVTGMQAARETINSFCVASGAMVIRPLEYGLMDALERYQKLNKEAKLKAGSDEAVENPQFWRDVIAGSIRETYQEATLKNSDGEEKSGLKKGLDFVKAWGKIARYAGMGITAGFHPENMTKSIESALGTVGERGIMTSVGHNFESNLERVAHVSLQHHAETTAPEKTLEIKNNHELFHHTVQRHTDVVEHPREVDDTQKEQVLQEGRPQFGDSRLKTDQIEERVPNPEFTSRHMQIESLESERAKLASAMKNLESSDSPKYKINVAQEDLEKVRDQMRPLLDAETRGQVDDAQQSEYMSKIGELQKQENELLKSIDGYKQDMSHAYGELAEYQNKIAQIDEEMKSLNQHMPEEYTTVIHENVPSDIQPGAHVGEVHQHIEQATKTQSEVIGDKTEVTQKIVHENPAPKAEVNHVVEAPQQHKVEAPLPHPAEAPPHHVAVEKISAGHLDHVTKLKDGNVVFQYNEKGEITGGRINAEVIIKGGGTNYKTEDAFKNLREAHVNSVSLMRTHVDSVNAKINGDMLLYKELLDSGHKKEADYVLKLVYQDMDETEKRLNGVKLFDRLKLPSLDGQNAVGEHLQNIPPAPKAEVPHHPVETNPPHAVEKNPIAPEHIPQHLEGITKLKTGSVSFKYDEQGNVVDGKINLDTKSYGKGDELLVGNYKEIMNKASFDGYRKEHNNWTEGQFKLMSERGNVTTDRVLVGYLKMYDELKSQGHPKEANGLLQIIYSKINIAEKNVGAPIFDRTKIPPLERN